MYHLKKKEVKKEVFHIWDFQKLLLEILEEEHFSILLSDLNASTVLGQLFSVRGRYCRCSSQTTNFYKATLL